MAAKRRRLGGVIGVAVVLALLGTGCGGDGDNIGESPTSIADDGSTGTSAAAPTGEPIVLGLYAPTQATSFSAPEMMDIGRATVEYVNEELGGVDGRPLRLEVCETRNTPDTMMACANELAQLDPVAIIGGPDSSATAALDSVFEPQGIPIIGGIGFQPSEVLGPDPMLRSMFIGSASALFPSTVEFAVSSLDARTVVAIGFESPFTDATVDAFVNPVMERAGLDPVELITAPFGTPDFTPFLQAAVDRDPDAIVAFGVPCVPIFRAYEATGSDISLIQPDTCSSASVLEEAGDLAEGKYFSYEMKGPQLDPDDEDVQTYVHVVDTYAPGTDNFETEIAASVFAGIMNLHALMLELDGDITPESVQAAVRQTVDQPNVLGYGPYSCATPPIDAFPGICSSLARIAQVVDGELVYATDVIDTSALLAP